jgi:hypothetical protein
VTIRKAMIEWGNYFDENFWPLKAGHALRAAFWVDGPVRPSVAH